MKNYLGSHPQSATKVRPSTLDVWRDYWIPALLISAFVGIACHRFIQHLNPRLWDFNVAYYPAGHVVLEHPTNLYSDVVVAGFVNLPLLAYLFTPFTLVQQPVAEVLFSILGLIAVLAIGYWLIQWTGVSGWRRTALIALMAINLPLYNSIYMGNTTHFVLLLLMGSFVCFREKRDVWSGVLLAIASRSRRLSPLIPKVPDIEVV